MEQCGKEVQDNASKTLGHTAGHGFNQSAGLRLPLYRSFVAENVSETWDAQTWEDLSSGVVTVPESAINDYLTTILPDYPAIRQAHISILPGNQIILELETPKNGRLLLKGTITRFVQNNRESSISIAVKQRKLLGKPLTSWVFAHISLGMLVKLFGNPLHTVQDSFPSRINGNVITINFRPYIDRSPLQTLSVYGLSPVDLFSIDSLSTEPGLIRLHTTYQGPAGSKKNHSPL